MFLAIGLSKKPGISGLFDVQGKGEQTTPPQSNVARLHGLFEFRRATV
jgi:hypothetical protein